MCVCVLNIILTQFLLIDENSIGNAYLIVMYRSIHYSLLFFFLVVLFFCANDMKTEIIVGDKFYVYVH